MSPGMTTGDPVSPSCAGRLCLSTADAKRCLALLVG
jgi:hypothetical protein